MSKDLVVLLSGGLDSATALAGCKDRVALALGIDYGQPHIIELEYAKRIAEYYGVTYLQLQVPMLGKADDVVFQGRNALLLTLGACTALAYGASGVVIGCNANDWERFPDCRPEFIKHISNALDFAYGVHVAAPFLRLSKAQVVQGARNIGLPIEQTWSCYQPQGEEPCGKCLACETRAKALS